MRNDLAIVGIEGIELRHDLRDRALWERWYPFRAPIVADDRQAIHIAKRVCASALRDLGFE